MPGVNVFLDGRIIHARYVGEMNLELVRQGQRDIEDFIAKSDASAILYDCLEMAPPTMNLALEMKAFDTRVRPKVVCCATVVKDAMTALMSKVAFAMARNHRVFYNDLDAAIAWLRSSAAGSRETKPETRV